MSITFSKKYHTCEKCGKEDSELFAIKYNRDISTGYPVTGRPEELKDSGIYIEELVRDEYGIIIKKNAIEKLCDVCNSNTLVANKVDNETNVLNFYPQTEAHKWLDGLGKAGL